MVDALREAWRVLEPRGLLVDLRPLPLSRCPLELVTPETAVQIGLIDASGMRVDDLAADDAVARAVDDGLFAPLSETRFEFEFSWDTVGELAAHSRGSRRVLGVSPSYADLERAYHEWCGRAAGKVRLRYTRSTLLAVYRKAGAG